MIAQELTCSHPNRVLTLTLFYTAPGYVELLPGCPVLFQFLL
jgi:hypothetical protein